MAQRTAKSFGMCLLKTREEKNLTRVAASLLVSKSVEALGKAERGEVGVTPCEALHIADCYGKPELMYQYCETCPIGKRLGKQAGHAPFPHTVLRISHMAQEAQYFSRSLMEIAFDGVVDDLEWPVFALIADQVRELRNTCNGLLAWADTLQKEGGRRAV